MTQKNRAMLRVAFLLAGASLLAACSTTPYSVGYDDKRGAQDSFAQNPYIHDGVIPGEEMDVLLTLSDSCHGQHSQQMAGAGQSTTTGAVGNAVGGFVGVGTGSQVFHGAKFLKYGGYGAGADAFVGGLNGAQVGSYALTTATAGCTGTFAKQLNEGQDKDRPDFKGMFDGLDVEPATAGKAWFGDRPPALDKDAPWPVKPIPPSGIVPSNNQ